MIKLSHYQSTVHTVYIISYAGALVDFQETVYCTVLHTVHSKLVFRAVPGSTVFRHLLKILKTLGLWRKGHVTSTRHYHCCPIWPDLHITQGNNKRPILYHAHTRHIITTGGHYEVLHNRPITKGLLQQAYNINRRLTRGLHQQQACNKRPTISTGV